MTSYVILLICANILIRPGIADDVLHSSTKSFGKYYVLIKELVKCNVSGPIHESIYNAYNVTIDEISDTSQIVKGYSMITEDFLMTKARYSTSVWKNGDFRPMLTRVINNPCNDEYAFKLIKISFKTDANCMVKKGNFTSVITDSNALTHKLFGNYFFYSKVHTRVEYYSSIGATFCIIVTTETKPLHAKVNNNINKKQ